MMNASRFVRSTFLLAGLLAVAIARPADAQFAQDWAKMEKIVPHGYVCYRATRPLTIDGRLDKPAWKVAPWTEDFADIEGSVKPKPKYRTRAKLLWDDDYLYLGAELEEPHVSGTITQRDAVIFQDNDFEVFIDPNGDNHEYYEIEINALNTVWDLLLKKPYKDGGPALNSWDIAGLKTAVHVNGTLNQASDTDVGWTVEFAFPWKALGEYAHRPAPPNEGDQWRINFSRVEWLYDIVGGEYKKVPNRREDNWVWSPQGIVDMHRPEKWGYLEFTRGEPGMVTFHPDPAAGVRNLLHKLYYAEREFMTDQKHWTDSPTELGAAAAASARTSLHPVIKLTPEGFTITAEARLADGRIQTWHISQDSRIWSD